MLVWILVIALVVILDQGSKALVMYGLGLDEVGESIPLIDGIFHFTHVRNTGAAFGMLNEENERWIFIVISIIGIAALIFYLWKYRPKSKWACAAISMIIGGGIGNMIDRLFRVGIVKGEERHYVFDFLDFCAFPNVWMWTFNVADAFVCIGAGILIIWCVYSLIVELKNDKKKAAVDIVLDENAENGGAIENGESEDTYKLDTAENTENGEGAENNDNEG